MNDYTANGFKDRRAYHIRAAGFLKLVTLFNNKEIAA
jgi:hypothetical protein